MTPSELMVVLWDFFVLVYRILMDNGCMLYLVYPKGAQMSKCESLFCVTLYLTHRVFFIHAHNELYYDEQVNLAYFCDT